MIFTGRPAARDKRAASSAASLVCFPPYAEPVSGTITRTLPSRIWNTAARSSRTAKGRCVPVQTEFPAGPLGNSGTRFERGVRDIGNCVRRVQTMCGTREAVVHGTFLIAMASFGTAGGLFLEIREEFLVRDLLTFFPLRVNGGNGVLCFALAGRGCANEIAIADDRHARHRFCGAVITRKERCAERGRAEDFAIEHPGRAQVRRVLVTAGNEGTAVDLWNRFAGNLPLRRRCDRIFRGQILCQRFSARELRISQRSA